MACAPVRELKVGDAVWARWTAELWYRGRIEAECAQGFKIRFDAQDEKCSPPAELAKDITPTRAALLPGGLVLAPDGEGALRDARVLASSGWGYAVQFGDGKRAEFPLHELRVPGGAPP